MIIRVGGTVVAAQGPMTLPAPKLLKDVLDGLTGKPVQLTPRSKKLTSVDATGGAIGLYVDDKNKPRALLGWSLSAAAYAGNAFALVPSAQAEKIVKERYLPDDCVEAVYELSNVLSSALAEEGNPHVRLQNLYHPAAAAPTEFLKMMYEAHPRMDLELEVPGYGSGLLSVVIAV
jgi:hypothetical protein